MKNNIRKILERKNMAQGELADQVGIKREYLNRIINDDIESPGIVLCHEIMKALEIRYDLKVFNLGEL